MRLPPNALGLRAARRRCGLSRGPATPVCVLWVPPRPVPPATTAVFLTVVAGSRAGLREELRPAILATPAQLLARHTNGWARLWRAGRVGVQSQVS